VRPEAALTVLFWIATALAAFGTLRRARMWARGQTAPLSVMNLLKVPKRYFVDLHGVVAREPFMAWTHVCVAGGAVVVLGAIALNYGFALYLELLDAVIAVGAGVMLVGALLAWIRRRRPPARLSRGPWMRLPYTLAAFAAGALLFSLAQSQLAGVLAALIALLLILVGTAELAFGAVQGGPMKHAVAGLLHLAFHPRPARFRGERATALEPIALKGPRFGVEKPADFRWNQLLGFDACVQCGKCEAACPAFAAGQPLNPKKLIQDLVSGLEGRSDAAYAGSPHPGLEDSRHAGAPAQPVVPELIEPSTLWSCTTCRACVQECPMLIEHVDAVVGLRRHQALSLGDVPEKVAVALDRLRETETVGGFARSARYHWAVDLDVRTARPDEPVDCLLVVGEGAFDMRYQRTLRALVTLLKAAAVDFAVMGEAERDCGDLARRVGDEATFQTLALRNIEALGKLSFKRIVTADPHVLHCLRNEYPALGGHFEVVHHTALLAELVREGRLSPGRSLPATRVTYHDPCYLARYNGEVDAPRQLLRGIGIEVVEMGRSGLRGRCCGGGGGAALGDVPGQRRIPDVRMDDARAVGAEIVAVACPNCTAMLEGVVGKRPEVLDVAELVSATLQH
jgi:Fe-S oxidoreductase